MYNKDHKLNLTSHKNYLNPNRYRNKLQSLSYTQSLFQLINFSFKKIEKRNNFNHLLSMTCLVKKLSKLIFIYNIKYFIKKLISITKFKCI